MKKTFKSGIGLLLLVVLYPPREGDLVSLDPALIVKPPQGYEVVYVPIVIGQR